MDWGRGSFGRPGLTRAWSGRQTGPPRMPAVFGGGGPEEVAEPTTFSGVDFAGLMGGVTGGAQLVLRIPSHPSSSETVPLGPHPSSSETVPLGPTGPPRMPAVGGGGPEEVAEPITFSGVDFAGLMGGVTGGAQVVLTIPSHPSSSETVPLGPVPSVLSPSVLLDSRSVAVPDLLHVGLGRRFFGGHAQCRGPDGGLPVARASRFR